MPPALTPRRLRSAAPPGDGSRREPCTPLLRARPVRRLAIALSPDRPVWKLQPNVARLCSATLAGRGPVSYDGGSEARRPPAAGGELLAEFGGILLT